MIQQGSCRFRVEGLGIIVVIVEIRHIVAIAIGLGFWGGGCRFRDDIGSSRRLCL